MTRAFSPLAQCAFDQWINMDTWHTGHACDEERFYVFVWAIVRFSRRRPDETEIQLHIRAAKAGKFDPEAIAFYAKKFGALYNHLYEFGKARKLQGTPVLEIARFLASSH